LHRADGADDVAAVLPSMASDDRQARGKKTKAPRGRGCQVTQADAGNYSERGVLPEGPTRELERLFDFAARMRPGIGDQPLDHILGRAVTSGERFQFVRLEVHCFLFHPRTPSIPFFCATPGIGMCAAVRRAAIG
jgi:hypothetical protein